MSSRKLVVDGVVLGLGSAGGCGSTSPSRRSIACLRVWRPSILATGDTADWSSGIDVLENGVNRDLVREAEAEPEPVRRRDQPSTLSSTQIFKIHSPAAMPSMESSRKSSDSGSESKNVEPVSAR